MSDDSSESVGDGLASGMTQSACGCVFPLPVAEEEESVVGGYREEGEAFVEEGCSFQQAQGIAAEEGGGKADAEFVYEVLGC